MTDNKKPFNEHDANRDPLSGETGSHPVGTGVGAAGAGAIGAAVGGIIGGPVGAVVGSAIGAVVGGIAGKGVAESVNPTVEDEYWRDNYATRPYVEQGHQYEDYQPAYRTGYEGYNRYASTGRSYDEVEPELQTDYEKNHGGAGLGWDKAKHAAKDAWHKVENALPGDNDQTDRTRTTAVNAVEQDAADVKLYEERLVADKHRAKTGEVAIGKHVETETARVSVPVERERVVIERVNPTGETVVAPGTVDFRDGEVAHVEVYEETPDIHKEAFVREEVRIKKEVDRDVVNAEEQIRREELDLDNTGRPNIDRRS
ncbi:YsnF/AvaK domain-containing protein [Leptolyngbya sp. FACHB-261]|uniref:YsnF/AvaK domain-containing protein n=1 Tax=Leptolyngbya sp. FACHB-261 TaxID=2692806 RepID=UPI001F54CADE|nr:DUF2382 domain-containing protein [Leptolyngbya sp. FACHB-261]